MRMIMIASLYNGESRVGFRILDADSIVNNKGQIIDVPDAKVYGVLSSNHIENIEIKNRKLHGSNGDIGRYPRIVDGSPQQTNALIIVAQLGEVGYIVCDYLGQVKRMRTEELIRLLSSYTLANGKLITKNGSQYISTILGKYHYISHAPLIDKKAYEVKKDNPRDISSSNNQVNNEQKRPQEHIEEPTQKSETENTDAKSYELSFNAEQASALKNYYTWANIDRNKANAEIVEISTAIKNKEIERLFKKTQLLNEMLAKLGSGFKIADVFGTELATHIATLISVGLPLPESMVYRCNSIISSDDGMILFYKKLFPEFESTVESIFNSTGDTFRVAAHIYLEHVAKRETLGDYKGMTIQSDNDALKISADYARVNDVSLTTIRALIGTINLLGEFSSTLTVRAKAVCGSRNLGKIHYAAVDFKKNSYINSPEKKLAHTVLNITIFTPSLGTKEYDTPSYNNYRGSSKRFLDEPMCREYPDCTFYSTPECSKTEGINSVYSELLIMLHNDEEKQLDIFLEYAKSFIQLRDMAQREQDRKATEELARRSIQRQQELKEQRQREEEERRKKYLEGQKSTNINRTGQSQSTQQIEHSQQASQSSSTAQAAKNNRTVATPESQKILNTGKTQLQIDLETGADISKYDPVQVFNELRKHTSLDPEITSIKIADDMISRKLIYRDMSSKQRYRINDAIRMMRQDIYGSTGTDTQSDSDKTSTQKKPSPENNKYQLYEHPDILDKINKLIKKSNSVEMVSVLEREPNVLKICYSILRYKTASDRQLSHVDNAIRILEEQ